MNRSSTFFPSCANPFAIVAMLLGMSAALCADDSKGPALQGPVLIAQLPPKPEAKKYDLKYKLWDAKTGADLRTRDATDKVLLMAPLPDGKQLITAAVDNTARLWDAASGTQIAKFERSGRSVGANVSPSVERRMWAPLPRAEA